MYVLLHSVQQFSTVAQSCPTLCDPMNRSTPGLPVHHQFPEFTQTCVHWVGDPIQPSHPLSSPSPPAFSLSASSQSQLLASGGQSIGISASTSVLPMNIHAWFPLGLIDWSPCSPRDSQEFSPAPFSPAQFKSIHSSSLSFLYSPTLTSMHNYWKNHSFDYMDLFQQSDIFAL